MSPRISFKIVPHKIIPGREVVEIFFDGEFCASIYADGKDPAGIKLSSAHFDGELTRNNKFPKGIKMDTGEKNSPPIPAINISFRPREYKIQGNSIVRISKMENHSCRYTEASRPFCSICGQLLGGF